MNKTRIYNKMYLKCARKQTLQFGVYVCRLYAILQLYTRILFQMNELNRLENWEVIRFAPEAWVLDTKGFY